MKTKKLLTLAIIALSIHVVGCKKDNPATPTTPVSEFKDQVMQGKINGEAWVMASGKAEVSSWDSTKFEVRFYDVADTTNCGFFSPSRNRVFGNIPRQTGKFSITPGGKAGITLFHNNTVMNYISEGTIEITKIETATNTIEGRLSIPGESDYTMNGNFSIKICN